MNFYLIMLNALIKRSKQGTNYLSYFKTEAQKAKRDNFIEYEDFLHGCLHVTNNYKEEIKKQFKNFLTKNDHYLSMYKKAIREENTKDMQGKLIQNQINSIEKEKNRILAAGYENNYDYKCFLTPTGDIAINVWDCDIDRILYWRDILQLENDLSRAINELGSTNSTHINVTPFQLSPSQINALKENYNFWLDKGKNKRTLSVNIFEHISFDEFIQMISNYDFNKVNIRGNKGRIAYNIYIISRLLGKEWGELAAKKLNYEFKYLTKQTKFYEYDDLKKMYLKQSP